MTACIDDITYMCIEIVCNNKSAMLLMDHVSNMLYVCG